MRVVRALFLARDPIRVRAQRPNNCSGQSRLGLELEH
jgi:hypothetical protein